ncbi:MAG: phage tail protein [Gammaproteobacteria bacterium]|nr:phage tail protein [Gammaproteobacteria bacterium]
MLKPDSLRRALTAACPALKRNPDKLHVFIDAGHIAAGAGGSLSFEYAYTLNLIVTDFEAHPDSLMVPILAWLTVNQPELLLNREKMRDGFTFEAEILNHTSADISIKLALTERVQVRDDAGSGRREVTHLPEPPLDARAEIETWELYVNGERVR